MECGRGDEFMQKGETKKGQENLWGSIIWASRSFSKSMPLILGVILLMGLFKNFISSEMLVSLFNGNVIRDTFTGAFFGSISAGNAVSSYIIGAELLKKSVSMFAVVAFLVTWVTVGIAQMPAEMGILGKRFTITRNVLSFALAILVSFATTITWVALS